MLHFLYSQIFRLVLPFLLIKLWWQGRRSPALRQGWRERLGLVARSEQPVIWVHAVSVGETIAAAPLVRTILERNPAQPVLTTAMTPTGSERARALFGGRVQYAYSPYDTPGSADRFVERVRPRILVIMETELWPNLIAACERRGVPVCLINARLSERSAQGYERVPSLARPLLQSIRWIAAQADDDAQRFCRIGARPDRVSVTGSVKFDIDVDDEQRQSAERLRSEWGNRPVWIAASTHDGEDEQLLEAHRRVQSRLPEALLVLVPRHPERFEAVGALIRSKGFRLALRSRNDAARGADVYLADTMGELTLLYGTADVAFVGGSLIERGGHNPLEPAAWGLPVVTGPHVFNFDTIYQQLSDGEAVIEVASERSLAEAVEQLLAEPAQARRLGDNARAVVEANRGALHRIVEGIETRLADQ
ncbi:3-deoxy-D-manno-octulosonic acid transferase [Tamilnaduibacter salinus]|uniref:3-deoxy-D-manno-octulosonic acid transferase n=1 Tax=Tamilnaduibacter salinus TaxID=1484056 RepID=A0A2A2I2K5_9GAMM|nr:lipid IV(A) 3-deoxy-D-manno-octulosonic acid transferase [Tamilnaduibacter salinus]PAV25867.1 3-deoxy-D-manno-octulosonic acid transferase [Tamilnaduibacter salinus]